MELFKHKNHRNLKYLNWIRKQKCVATGKKAECAHHIRINTNGGSSIKPSDYFCIPLTNEYHTTGLFAIHVIGEETFLKELKLTPNELFVNLLKQFLLDEFNVLVHLENKKDELLIAYMIEMIEENGPKFDGPKKRKKPKNSITDNEFYQKAKEIKSEQDKELRAKIKEETKALKEKITIPKKTAKTSVPAANKEYYEKAKEYKRVRDKELRTKIKIDKKENKTKVSATQTDFYEKAKELKRQRDKEFRDKLKEKKLAAKAKKK